MNHRAKGEVIIECRRVVHEDKLEEMASALNTSSGGDAARMVPFFGAALAGDMKIASVLDIDMARALLVGHSYEFVRPFRTGEWVRAVVSVEDVYRRGENDFAVVLSEFRDDQEAVIQRQRSTFIEMAAQLGSKVR